MMWTMLICALPLVILFFAGRAFFSTEYLWPILIGAMVVMHLRMMLRGHGHESSGEKQHDARDVKQVSPGDTPHADEKEGYSDNSGCH